MPDRCVLGVGQRGDVVVDLNELYIYMRVCVVNIVAFRHFGWSRARLS